MINNNIFLKLRLKVKLGRKFALHQHAKLDVYRASKVTEATVHR